jgi:hypothetical protein
LLYAVGPKESGDETEEEEFDASFRISSFKLPIHALGSLTYAAVLKQKKQDYLPAYAQPLSTTHPKPIIKKGTQLERDIRREFLTTQRAGVKLHTFKDIDEYFTEQKKEHYKEKATAEAMAQIAQQRVRVHVQEHFDNKKYTVQKLMARDNEKIQKALQQVWQDRLNYLKKVRERRTLFLAEKKQKAADRLLVQKLNNEHTFLSREMTKTDRLKKNEAILKQRYLMTQQKIREEKYRQDLLKEMKKIR